MRYNQSVSRRLNLGDDRHASACTLLLDQLKIGLCVRFVETFVQPIKACVASVQAESRIQLLFPLSGEILIDIGIVAEVNMKSVLLEE